jgi:hypothetical protein
VSDVAHGPLFVMKYHPKRNDGKLHHCFHVNMTYSGSVVGENHHQKTRDFPTEGIYRQNDRMEVGLHRIV